MNGPFSGGFAFGSIRYVCARASCDAQLPLPRLFQPMLDIWTSSAQP
jgi:uncharacterized protein YfbU (UPF0304 family)